MVSFWTVVLRRTGALLAILAGVVLIASCTSAKDKHAIVVEFIEEKCFLAYPNQIADFDFKYTKNTITGKLILHQAQTSPSGDEVVTASVKIECKESNAFRSVNKLVPKDDDIDFTVCLENRKNIKGCSELTLERIDGDADNMKNVFDLCDNLTDEDSVIVLEYGSKTYTLPCE